MSKIHIVKQGEHLSRIAAVHNFGDWHIIWDHPDNAALKEKRDPHVLFPGDEVSIPDREEKVEAGETAQIHIFLINIPPLYLRLRLHDIDDKVIAGAACELGLESDVATPKTTDAKGIIEHPIQRMVENGELRVRKTKPPAKKGGEPVVQKLKFDLKIGDLNPETKLSGQQARLNNLGYFAGFTPEDLDQFLWAVEEFQCDHMSKPVTKKPVIIPESEDTDAETGVTDAKTRKKLKELHGF